MSRKTKNFTLPRQDLSEAQMLEIKAKMKEKYGEKRGEEIFFKSRSAGKFDMDDEEQEQNMQQIPVGRNNVGYDETGACYRTEDCDSSTGIRFVGGIAERVR